MARRNRAHLAEYEADNVVMSISTAGEAEIVVRDLVNDSAARNCFFVGVFDRETEALRASGA